MNPQLLADAIHDEMDELTKLVDEMRAAGNALAGAERDYKVAHAKARLRARASGEHKTVDAVNDYATLKCADSLFSYTLAQSTMQTIREALRASEARLDGLRSLSASVRGAGG